MACNTATSAAVITMREKFNIPVISMEPAVKPALAALDGGKALVLATPATVSQPRYLRLLERIGAGDDVISVGCDGLAHMIEQGQTDEKNVHDFLSITLSGVNGSKIDAVVLGCTHYAFVEKHIKSFVDQKFGADSRIFDGRHGTAKHLRSVLEKRGIRCGTNRTGRIEFLTSGQADDAKKYKIMFDTIK